MIYVATKNETLRRFLEIEFKILHFNFVIAAEESGDALDRLYDSSISSVIIDEDYFSIPSEAMIDIISSMSLKRPVILLQKEVEEKRLDGLSDLQQAGGLLTIFNHENRDDILATVTMFSGHERRDIKHFCRSIPFYNPLIPVSRLRENGGLGIITIDASNFSKIGLEYGVEVYTQLRNVFHDLLFEMWGQIGSFRNTDIICKKAVNSNVYYVFLSRSRETGSLPLPGALEKLADRISGRIQNRLLNELFAPRFSRRIPSCIQSVPTVGVGFFGVLNNPCIDSHELIDRGLEASRKMAEDQLCRVKERQRELMQMLIQSDDLLFPHYQGVFHLQNLTKEHIDQVNDEKSINAIKDHIFGFESLIRIDQVASRNFLVDSVIGLDPKYLRPDVLFSMASDTKVGLELDQTCLKHAASHSKGLPGTLMVNILPRNLYYIGRLKHIFHDINRSIMFEVSESEAINNFELLLESCAALKRRNIDIAADDFGKGFSSLERVLKIKPAVIKFDRSIIQDIHKDPIKQAYVKGMVSAGRFLKTTILAEGVEKWEEAEVLQQMGIELIQGFLLHKPETASKIINQLSGEEKKTKPSVA